jgi:hypothetical protein
MTQSVQHRSIAGLPQPTAAVYVLLFIVAFVGYSWAWPQAPVQEGDSPQYLEVAQDLLDFRLDTLHDRAPGYPLLLVSTGSAREPQRALFLVSLLLHLASVWLLAAALRSAGAGSSLLLLFGSVLLLPPFVEPAAHVMTENLAQFTLAAGTACLVLGLARRRYWWVALASIAFAGAALTRPTYQALTIVLSGCIVLLGRAGAPAGLSMRESAKASVVLVLGSVILLGTVAWSNARKFSYPGIVPTAGIHLSTKTMGIVERLPEEYAVVREILVRERDAQLTRRGGTHTGTQTIWSVRPEVQAATGLSKAELSGFLLRMNLTLIARAPMEYLQEVARSVSGYWFPAAGALASMDSSALRWLWAGLHAAIIGIFFLQVVAVAGVATCRAVLPARRGSPDLAIEATGVQISAYVLAGVIVLYTMVLSCFLDIGEVRQRRPTDVLVVFMCAVGVCVWIRTKCALPAR